MKVVHNFYDELISFENLYAAWRDFRSGKSGKVSVIEFEHNLENNLFALREELQTRAYCHGNYEKFIIRDPKERVIHKAAVRDRVVHTLVARKLEEIYQGVFIANSFACQKDRGAHRALQSVSDMCRQASLNYTSNCWYLKCDIKKFFDHIDHNILLKILRRKIKDDNFLWLIECIAGSFYKETPAIGLPLGNFTSQWLANIYLNELDYFIKHGLKIKHYARYADDFIFLSGDKAILSAVLEKVREFLTNELKLTLHPNKITRAKFSAGIEWVGYTILPHYLLLKKPTKRRLLRRMRESQIEFQVNKIGLGQYADSLNSYLGLMSHCQAHELSDKIVYNI